MGEQGHRNATGSLTAALSASFLGIRSVLPNDFTGIKVEIFLFFNVHVKYLYSIAFAGLNIWPSFHDALSNASVFVGYSTDSNGGAVSSATLSLVNMETNATVLSRTLPNNHRFGRVEFNCSCFLYAGTFRFLLRQTRTTSVLRANGTGDGRTEATTWWWSSELQVHWPTFHIAVEKTENHSGSFQVIKTDETDNLMKLHQGSDSPLFLCRSGYPRMNTFKLVHIVWTLLSS